MSFRLFHGVKKLIQRSHQVPTVFSKPLILVSVFVGSALSPRYKSSHQASTKFEV
jgi:hypothetical protein